MQIIRSITTLQSWRHRQQSKKGIIGLVPTMGALHPGHLSLIQRARRTCQTVVVSLFVNPLQFSPKEDLTRYPRPIKTDLNLCRQQGVDLVFLPTRQALYPPNFQTSVTVTKLTQRWEGEYRPTHFQGVTTIVTKLLNLLRPDRAFFGQKDYQQYVVVHQLAKDLNLEAKIVCCPTVRHRDGLAWSSRNQYLSQTERAKGAVLYQALVAGRQAIREGEKSVVKICTMIRKIITANPQIKIDYLEICDLKSLEPLKKIEGRGVILGGIRLGEVRLIDNVFIDRP